MNRQIQPRLVDGLTSIRPSHRQAVDVLAGHSPWQRAWRRQVSHWQRPLVVIGLLLFLFGLPIVAPKVQSFGAQLELLDIVKSGRYLLLLQNNAEIRGSGGFIGSYAIVDIKDGQLSIPYFEKNIYQLDDAYSQSIYRQPPKPLVPILNGKGLAMHDSNFAADFQQSAQTVAWYWQDELARTNAPIKGEILKSLGDQTKIDGVIAFNLSGFVELLKLIGPLQLDGEAQPLTSENFFPIVQRLVEVDYFKTEANKQVNQPKTVLAELIPQVLAKATTLNRQTQYQLLKQAIERKDLQIYSLSQDTNQALTKANFDSTLPKPEKNHDFLAMIRSAHGGNKSSLDIQPIVRYELSNKSSATETVARLSLTFEHQGDGAFPSGVNKEYIRYLLPKSSRLISANSNGQDLTRRIDQGTESGYQALGFWLITEPKTSTTINFEIGLGRQVSERNYRLQTYRQSGSRPFDLTVALDNQILYQAKLSSDRLIRN